jgi:hypothetical protein
MRSEFAVLAVGRGFRDCRELRKLLESGWGEICRICREFRWRIRRERNLRQARRMRYNKRAIDPAKRRTNGE